MKKYIAIIDIFFLKINPHYKYNNSIRKNKILKKNFHKYIIQIKLNIMTTFILYFIAYFCMFLIPIIAGVILYIIRRKL